MNEEMREGARIALQGVKEEMNTITVEMKRKGNDEPKGFSILRGYIEDTMKGLEK